AHVGDLHVVPLDGSSGMMIPGDCRRDVPRRPFSRRKPSMTALQPALRLRTRVLPGNRIEVTAPELKEGETVDVFLVLPGPGGPEEGRSALDIIRGLQGHRLFRSPEDVDRYLEEGRGSWDR